ncbi:uncharacterized mitochondrial protein AtMg00810-like [Lactuca sativa]|uniref:uncharacterized mitochondrial protein AtMg00810-like n=1 Tax=Lactuca sativa TaxID=4236 RepID=UPI001C688871|nr:uncharacterized mitochondrial protein AtMg00810-like [Lactuca sativa]
MAAGTRLGPSLDKLVVDITLYRIMFGSLLYLTTSRPDIMFVVCNCASYQSNPREPHMTIVKNIFRYLKGTISLRLWYASKTGFFIQAFSDVGLGGCKLDKKSTSSGCQFLDGKLVSWQLKKPTCVSISTAEAEYVVDVDCTSQSKLIFALSWGQERSKLVEALWIMGHWSYGGEYGACSLDYEDWSIRA